MDGVAWEWHVVDIWREKKIKPYIWDNFALLVRQHSNTFSSLTSENETTVAQPVDEKNCLKYTMIWRGFPFIEL